MSSDNMPLACPAALFETAVAFSLPRLLAASGDITTPIVLFYRICLIAQGNSMRELDEILKTGLADVFDDICAILPTLHEQNPAAPTAMQIFTGIVMGVALKSGKKDGALDCLAALLGAVHSMTHPLRSMPAGRHIPNSLRVNLFHAVLEILRNTIPLKACPLGFGNPLNPSEFMKGDNVKQKLSAIQNHVDILIASASLD